MTEQATRSLRWAANSSRFSCRFLNGLRSGVNPSSGSYDSWTSPERRLNNDQQGGSMTTQQLKPASELAQKSEVRFPNESEQYRRARTALLAEEIELRRHIERVAEQRRALPPGGMLSREYHF